MILYVIQAYIAVMITSAPVRSSIVTVDPSRSEA
jgi:hypothetical protein